MKLWEVIDWDSEKLDLLKKKLLGARDQKCYKSHTNSVSESYIILFTYQTKTNDPICQNFGQKWSLFSIFFFLIPVLSKWKWEKECFDGPQICQLINNANFRNIMTDFILKAHSRMSSSFWTMLKETDTSILRKPCSKS